MSLMNCAIIYKIIKDQDEKSTRRKRKEQESKKKDFRNVPETPVEPVDKLELLRGEKWTWKARS